ncbi:MAG: M20/M25/M40 family metallo-hydrolase, partial [Bacteroidia bacterium]
MSDIKQYIEQNKQRFLDELFALLRIPSISADSAFAGDVAKAADFVAERMREAGADKVEVCKTPGHPIVYGEKIIDPSLPTVLVYGHYDVQPAVPLELWDTPPFEPTIKKTELHPEGAIFARGSADDKGQFYMHVKAFEYMMKNNALPCNIKMMIEGEEEVGSNNLADFCIANKERLKADVVLISDTSIIANDCPSIDTGLRGLCYVEVEVTGPNRDLHSGVYGGAVANPITVLAQMIASCHDENNHITIPGFYDDVVEATPAEREKMAKAPFDESAYKADLGITELWGEKGFTTNERTG